MSIGECTIGAIREARHLGRETCNWGRVMRVVIFVFVGREKARLNQRSATSQFPVPGISNYTAVERK